jgi:hypothetical protein
LGPDRETYTLYLNTDVQLLGFECKVIFPAEDMRFLGMSREGFAGESHDFLSVSEKRLDEGEIRVGDIVALDLGGLLEPGLHEVVRLDFRVLRDSDIGVVTLTDGRAVAPGPTVGPILIESPAGLTPGPVEDVESIALRVAPNPFHGGTTIRYGVPSSGRVRVGIYSVSGRLVRTLVDRTEKVGRYEVAWDGENDKSRSVPAGIYFCKVTTPHGREMRKVVLMD